MLENREVPQQENSECFILLDSELNILNINQNTCHHFKWNEQEIIGQPFLINFYEICSGFPVELKDIKPNKPHKFTMTFVERGSATHQIRWTIHLLEQGGALDKKYLFIGHPEPIPPFETPGSDPLTSFSPNLQNIIACMPGSVYWKDRKGIYRGCNDEFLRMFGFKSQNEVIGKSDIDIAHLSFGHEIALSFQRVDNEVMSTGVARLGFEEPPFALADGSIINQLDSKVPLRNEQGDIVGLVGIGIDITERKRLERELYEAKKNAEEAIQEKTYLLEEISKEARNAFANLQSIVACMPGSIYWKDRNGVYRGCNDLTVQMSGYAFREELIGKTDDDLAEKLGWDKSQVDEIKRIDQEVITTGHSLTNYELPAVKVADGSTPIHLTNKVPLRDGEGSIIGVLGISIDITNRNKIEKELELAKQRAELANKAKSHFLCIVSHELRTPLTGILGMAQLLNSKHTEINERKEYSQAILKAGTHLLSLINNILDFTRLEEGKFELSPSPIDFKILVEEVSLMLSAQAKAKGIELLISYEPSIPNKIVADSRALRQIIINLVGNALKFTSTGHILTKVRTVEHAGNSVKLELSVTDTGIGIPKDKLKTIFEHFQQLDSPYTRTTEGSGLGLSITKNLIELMDGEIAVTSEEGKGSTFSCTFDFPLQGEGISELPWSIYEGNVRTLVVDDTARAEVIRKQISTSNCQTAAGFEALNTLISAQTLGDPFKIVIIDQQLTSADPIELLHAINNRRKLEAPMPVLLASSGTLKAKKAAIESGFFEIIVKPVRPIELQTAITTAWERWAEKLHLISATIAHFKVLLVEDNKVIQIVHKNFLENLGCIVHLAENAEETYAQYANKKFDLILMDVGLPGVSGPMITKEIRRIETEKQLERTPIVALTGYDDQSHIDVCLQAGMDEVVIKPIQQENLQKLINRRIQAKHHRIWQQSEMEKLANEQLELAV
jgi:PAS domain S-box-containing protein